MSFEVAADAYDAYMGRHSAPLAPALADLAGVDAGQTALDVGCGPGALTAELVRRLGPHAVAAADPSEPFCAAARARYPDVEVRRASAEELPFPDGAFDAVVSNDAMCHIADRPAVLKDWYRVLRPGGRALFTDAMVLTGIVSSVEFATRSSIGFYLFVPPGLNERLLQEAGFTLRAVQDVTDNAAEVAGRWHDARARHERPLVTREGEANFQGLQRFLRCVQTLSVERRMSRYAYVAEKPA